jgi:hypothetical protein
MVVLRARVISFLAGFAVAGGFALYQLRQDVWESHRVLAAQVSSLPARIFEKVPTWKAGVAFGAFFRL